MTAREVIAEAKIYAQDPNSQFHTPQRLLSALNRALREISSKSRSITEQHFWSVDASRYQYPLSVDTLEIRKAKYLNGQWQDLARGFFDETELVASRSGGGPPCTFALGVDVRHEKFVGEVVGAVYDESLTPPRIRQATINKALLESSGDAAAANEFKLGDWVTRISEGKGRSEITELSASGNQTSFRYYALGDGTTDRLAVGDMVQITSPHTQGKAILISPSPSVGDEEGLESLSAFVSRAHRTITQTHIDNENDALELDLEFDDTLLYEMLHWLHLGREGLESAAQRYKAMAANQYSEKYPRVKHRVAANLNAWERGLALRGSYRDVDSLSAGGSWNDYLVR